MARATSKKSLLSEFPTAEEAQSTLIELINEPDHSAVMTGVAFIDWSLKKVLEAHLISEISPEEHRRLFNPAPQGLLGSVASKYLMCYAMGLITKEIYDEIVLINDIRNVFAHSMFRIDFKNKHIKQDVDKLKAYKFGDFKIENGTTKAKWVISVLKIHIELVNIAYEKITRKALIKALGEYGQDSVHKMIDLAIGSRPSSEKSARPSPDIHHDQ